MRYRRVLLLFPDYKGGHFGALRPPAGLGYLAQVLENNGIDYDVVDMAAGYGLGYLRRKLKVFKPDMVAVSLMSFIYHRSYEIIRFVKDHLKDVSVVVGGPHVSTLRERVLEQCNEIDFGVVLEGETSLLELCEDRELSKIKGLIFREKGTVIYNGDRAFESDLDGFPFPQYNKFPLKRYVTEEMGIVTSRGCPFNCVYCPVTTAIGRKYRARSAQSVVEEIAYWYQRGYRQFSMLDDNFTLHKPRVLEICKEIKQRNLGTLELNCNNGVRADTVNRELLTGMREAGFKYLAFGVEAGNDRTLKNIKKGESIEAVKQAIELALELGFEVTLFFLVGSPGETLKDVGDSINLATRYPVFDARFYNLIPFPATELYSWAAKNDYFISDPNKYLNNCSQWDSNPVFATPEFSKDERVKALNMVRKVRKRIRYNSMKKRLSKFGFMAACAARLFVSDWFQKRLMFSSRLRRNLKRLYMRVASSS